MGSKVPATVARLPTLRARFERVERAWHETTDRPFPPADPRAQGGSSEDPVGDLQAAELELVELLARQASAERATDIALRTWELVHDRPRADPVRRRVEELHGELTELRKERTR